jgi:hypothetical protein
LAGGPFDCLADVGLPLPGSDAWEPLTFPSIRNHTQYAVVGASDLGGRPAWRAHAQCSASAMALSLADRDPSRSPRLSWRWKVERGLDVEDERVRSGDDFAARVYVLRPFDPTRASWFERVRRRLARSLYGRDLPGSATSYVWTSHVAPGTRWPNPYSAESTMVALRSGASPGWQQETIDLAAQDMAIAIMSDADDSCGEAIAWFADFRLLGGSPGAPAITGNPEAAGHVGTDHAGE